MQPRCRRATVTRPTNSEFSASSIACAWTKPMTVQRCIVSTACATGAPGASRAPSCSAVASRILSLIWIGTGSVRTSSSFTSMEPRMLCSMSRRPRKLNSVRLGSAGRSGSQSGTQPPPGPAAPPRDRRRVSDRDARAGAPDLGAASGDEQAVNDESAACLALHGEGIWLSGTKVEHAQHGTVPVGRTDLQALVRFERDLQLLRVGRAVDDLDDRVW